MDITWRALLISTTTTVLLILEYSHAYKTLPVVPYDGPLDTNQLPANKRSDVIIMTTLESGTSQNSIALVFVVAVKSDTSPIANGSIVGYYQFNDRSAIDYLTTGSRILDRLYMERLHISINGSNVLGYLETNYLNITKDLFNYNMHKSRSKENQREALGLQLYATYPGTRRCQAGRQVSMDTESVPLKSLDKCCYMRSICNLQSDSNHQGVATPTAAADKFRRVLCQCDQQYRDCLLSLNSTEASYMGELIFNVLGLQCFYPTCNGTRVPSYEQCKAGHLAFRWEREVEPYPL